MPNNIANRTEQQQQEHDNQQGTKLPGGNYSHFPKYGIPKPKTRPVSDGPNAESSVMPGPWKGENRQLGGSPNFAPVQGTRQNRDCSIGSKHENGIINSALEEISQGSSCPRPSCAVSDGARALGDVSGSWRAPNSGDKGSKVNQTRLGRDDLLGLWEGDDSDLGGPPRLAPDQKDQRQDSNAQSTGGPNDPPRFRIRKKGKGSHSLPTQGTKIGNRNSDGGVTGRGSGRGRSSSQQQTQRSLSVVFFASWFSLLRRDARLTAFSLKPLKGQ